MIGSIAGIALIVLGGLAVSAWIRLRGGGGTTSNADNSASPTDGTTSDGDSAGWLSQLFANSTESGTSAEHHASASDTGNSDSGGSDSVGGHSD